MLANGEVAKYTIIDNRKTVKVYLTDSAQKKYQAQLKKAGKVTEKGPHMSFKITTGEAFQKEISEFLKVNPTVKEVPSDIENERDIFGVILQF